MQLVEQSTDNLKFGGSNPGSSVSRIIIAEKQKQFLAVMTLPVCNLPLPCCIEATIRAILKTTELLLIGMDQYG